MNSENAITEAHEPGLEPKRIFTVDTANRALVFVRKVVQELVDHYAELMRLRAEREELASAVVSEDRSESLDARIERSIDALNELQTELHGVGCELKDWSDGLIDFPATYEGRRVWLCWRLGEPSVAYWHELDASFAGRQPIAEDVC